MATGHDVTVFIDPFSHHFCQDRLFAPTVDILGAGALFGGENILAPYLYLRNRLRAHGIRVHTADYLLRGEACRSKNIYISFGICKNYRQLARRPNVTLSAFFAFEGPIVDPAMYLELASIQNYVKRIYSFSDSEALKSFLRRPITCRRFHIPQRFDGVREDIWRREDRSFLVMINSNRLPRIFVNELYTERMRALEFFSRTAEIDLYGLGWDGASFRPGGIRLPGTIQGLRRRCLHYWEQLRPNPLLRAARRVWKGTTLNKGETLGKYIFALCFDNQILKGWITEKIFDCFFCGTIPIYWGAPDIADYVPKECFIDMRRFSGYPELRTYLKSLSGREIRAYREQARAFLESPRFRPFTKQAFAELIGRIIEEDAGIRILESSSAPISAPDGKLSATATQRS
jgi:alpha(1,3/1,4) fucosyltransferase